MPQQADANYSNRPWSQTNIQRANPTYEDAMQARTLATALEMTADQIRQIRPPMPIELFPPRFGYRDEALGIADVVSLDDIYERRDFSQRQSGYSGTSYPSLNVF